METNLTTKKPYNVTLLLAGISLALYALGMLLTQIITLIPFVSHKYGMSQGAIITQIILSIVPVLLLVVSLFFCVFMFIGKPKVMFSLYYIVIILFYLYTAITGAFTIISLISQFTDSLSYGRYMAATYGYFTIYNLIFLVSALIMIVGFVTAFIISLISLIKKKAVKIWFIPGIIVGLGFIVESIGHIIVLFRDPVIHIIASILDMHTKVTTHTDFSSILSTLLNILITFCLVLGTFFLCKGSNK